MRRLAILTILTALLSAPAAGEAPGLLLQLEYRGRTYQATPLVWNESQVQLLSREGRILKLHPSEAGRVSRRSERFRSYSPAEMKSLLQWEFGADYAVSAAGAYLVVHPRSQTEPFAARFDALYRSFVHYFTARGVELSRPRFPLVAVVLPSRAAFHSYARRDNAVLPNGAVGYYSLDSNRIVQFVQPGGWERDLTLIVHEASHQSAFNTGLHHRGSTPPKWLGEGLGTLFEARGVWNSQQHRLRSDRINAQMLSIFRKQLPRREPGVLATMIRTDRAFDASDPMPAYADAWALTFFLSETRPRQLAAYLQATGDARRPAKVAESQRLAEFTQAFGDDLRMLEAQMLRFLAEVSY